MKIKQINWNVVLFFLVVILLFAMLGMISSNADKKIRTFEYSYSECSQYTWN